MSELATLPPPRRLDLVVRPIGEDGRHVVKTPDSGEYFTLGAQEAFLLLQLDGRQPAAAIRTAFQGRFGEPLSETDFGQFVDLSRSLGFVQPPGTEPAPTDRPRPRTRGRQSLLYWRARLFDPDRLFSLLEPHLRFLWTRVFLVASAVAILAAAGMVWADRGALASGFAHVQRWETWAIALFTLVAATALHECAHGLTCKHYGGEVHEVGFLLMYFMPCFYCNVSDAWLFKEKSKRLWVTLAGGYCDLCVWAGAAFVWRLAAPHTLVNYLAWVVLSVVGARVFFNFNPLIKLDGYYLLGA